MEETISGWLTEGLDDDLLDDIEPSRGDTLVGVPARQATPLPAATEPPPTEPEPGEQPGATASEPPQAELAPAETDTAPVTEPGAATPPAADLSYPTELIPAEPLPYLVVRECSQAGVLIAFDARWLTHEGFRSSPPVRCIFSGVRDRNELCARPMAFMDRYRGPERSPSTVESRHELRPRANQDHREIVRMMGRITSMPPPFDSPVPYFVSKHHMSSSMSCRVELRPDGGYTCQVRVPDGRVALEWLARVNGTCGPEYELLRTEVALLGSDAWRALPEKVRQRLQVWAKFEPREHFRLYLSDADFGSHDVGLAGLVVTNRRLIFHKYHHSGDVRFDEDAALLVRIDGKVASITLNARGRRASIGKINFKEMSRLMEAVASAPKLKLEMSSR